MAGSIRASAVSRCEVSPWQPLQPRPSRRSRRSPSDQTPSGSSSSRSRLAWSGFLIILLYVVCAIGAQWICPIRSGVDRFRRHADEAQRRALVRHRPVRARRVSAASSTARARRWPSASFRRSSGAPLGALVGATSGYFGGRIDTAIQRVVDIMLSFPIIVLAMVVVAVLGKRTCSASIST